MAQNFRWRHASKRRRAVLAAAWTLTGAALGGVSAAWPAFMGQVEPHVFMAVSVALSVAVAGAGLHLFKFGGAE